MTIDQDSLFAATGICAAALALTMLSVWVHNRADRFLVGWTAGMLLLGAGVLLYLTFPPDDIPLVAAAFGMEILGFVIVYVAARQFTGRPTSGRRLAALLTAVPVVTLPILAGFDGLGIMIYNFLAGALLAATGARYWTTRAEAPSSIVALCLLYGMAALSFLACGVMLAREANWVMHARPDNWAEQFNAIMCIAGITGIGALSLGLNHARAARRHRLEAQTDALTGLLNRRAVFDRLNREPLAPGHAVIAFDLDRFKTINDRHGHATGDEVLRRFARTLRDHSREGDIAARIGGEEFVLVLPATSAKAAIGIAERIRAAFAETTEAAFATTASAGVALIKAEGERFEDVLHRADTSLYRAKDGGRDRVAVELQAVA